MDVQRVLIIGLGCSGRAAARFLLRRKAHVVAVDGNRALLQHQDPELAVLETLGLKILHEDDLTVIKEFSLVVTSPGVSSQHRLVQMALETHIEVIGEVELACRHLGSHRVVGVTGTNGKTTVTLLVAHVLNESGIPARAAGNVGMALCDELDRCQNQEVLVVELSSYQLETMQSAVLDAAVILNITPDHLDRHGTMAAYAKAKLRIASCLKPGGRLFVQEQVARTWSSLLEGFSYRVFGGESDHHAENQQAARCLCTTLGVNLVQFAQAMNSFETPPHRIQYVRCWNGVHFIDDSKGTNIDAVIKAVTSLSNQTILIAGGVDKGASYIPWLEGFHGKVRVCLAMGQAAPKIFQELTPRLPVELMTSLEAAVKRAAELANPGENVLLSPGCSSFDMFRDYAHRGEEFQRIVRELPSEAMRQRD